MTTKTKKPEFTLVESPKWTVVDGKDVFTDLAVASGRDAAIEAGNKLGRVATVSESSRCVVISR